MKYKLLKDLPDVKANTVGFVSKDDRVCFERNNIGSTYQDANESYSPYQAYDICFVKNNPGWFEPVIERWRAFENSDFYVVNNYLDVVNFTEEKSHGDNRLFDAGNYFKKRDQAEEASRRFKKVLMDYHKEISNEI